MATDNALKVEKLNGENYHGWKFQMKMYLIRNDLWDITTGTETLADDATAEEQRKFKKRENLALASACLSLASLQIYIRSAGNAKEAWENRKSHFQKKSLSRKIFYRGKLYSPRMEEGTSMMESSNNLNNALIDFPFQSINQKFLKRHVRL